MLPLAAALVLTAVAAADLDEFKVKREGPARAGRAGGPEAPHAFEFAQKPQVADEYEKKNRKHLSIPAKVTRYGPFDNPKEIAAYPLTCNTVPPWREGRCRSRVMDHIRPAAGPRWTSAACAASAPPGLRDEVAL